MLCYEVSILLLPFYFTYELSQCGVKVLMEDQEGYGIIYSYICCVVQILKCQYKSLKVYDVKVTLGQLHEKLVCTALEYTNKQQ